MSIKLTAEPQKWYLVSTSPQPRELCAAGVLARAARRSKTQMHIMRLLLHACCGPCTAGTLRTLDHTPWEPVLYWNNPNIHPFTEYESRLGGLLEMGRLRRLPVVVDGDYGVRRFTKEVSRDLPGRCVRCYELRLNACAERAAADGMDAFSTTLLVSPYQDQESIRMAGEAAAAQYGVPFLYMDFRPGFRDGQQEARQAGLYMQKYCGCIYSEEERYAKRNARIRKGLILPEAEEGNRLPD